MKRKVLIVEDEFIEANNLQMILEKAGYIVCGIARSVPLALEQVEKEKPDMVLVDIFLKGNLTGIDLARRLRERHVGFVYLSANSNQTTLDEAKLTRPYGFLVKPFREKDLLITLDIAWYLHEEYLSTHQRPPDAVAINKGASSNAFRNIIGNSEPTLQMLDEVAMVAPTDTSVLLLGESGTGKELVAASLHTLSPRANKPFIKVNCAALPPTLIESELFGHERGAFTGAIERRIGKFEQANKGTIFLDEIGEMPPETQVKLLRVLQEKEIERIGGKETIKTDVRVIAATNKHLEKEIAEGRFRLDLYYRLNVFPITLPPLRERREDIPLLAMHFMHQFSKVTGKRVTEIAPGVMQQLTEYDWPGNIRELEHLMERTVLMTAGTVVTSINLLKAGKSPAATDRSEVAIKSMDENERDHIIAALKKCNGKIAGDDGAAALLNIHVSTLNARIKKHSIQKEHYYTIEK